MKGAGLRSVIGASILFAACSSFAQTFGQYLTLRQQNHIRYGSSAAALDVVVGEKVLEIKARVTGSFSVDGQTIFLVQDADGTSINVISDTPPDWLQGGAVDARLIVRAYRANDASPLRVRLLGAAPESQVEAVEEQERQQDQAAAAAEAARQKAAKSRGGEASLTSRHSGGRQWTVPQNEVAPYYAQWIVKDNPKVSWAKAMKIANEIIAFGQMYGVDPRLVMAMVTVESDFNTQCVSTAGAMGLGQLMPCNVQDLGITDPFDTQQNLAGSVKLLRDALEKYKKQTGQDFDALVLCMAAYNAGDGAVAKYHGVPPYKETQNYVRKVIKLYYRFCGR